MSCPCPGVSACPQCPTDVDIIDGIDTIDTIDIIDRIDTIDTIDAIRAVDVAKADARVGISLLCDVAVSCLLEEVVEVGVELWVFTGDYLSDFAFRVDDNLGRVALHGICLVGATFFDA